MYLFKLLASGTLKTSQLRSTRLRALLIGVPLTSAREDCRSFWSRIGALMLRSMRTTLGCLRQNQRVSEKINEVSASFRYA